MIVCYFLNVYVLPFAVINADDDGDDDDDDKLIKCKYACSSCFDCFKNAQDCVVFYSNLTCRMHFCSLQAYKKTS